jgi:hypothetical protein
MKKLLMVSCVSALLAATQTVQAASVTLFSDNFNAAGTTNTFNINYNLAGREGGTLGTGGLIS